jgi:hypothetical protein
MFGKKQERTSLVETEGLYGAFWSWFMQNEKEFHKAVKERDNIEAHFFDKLEVELRKINSGIYFLAGMLDDNTVDMIFSPDGAVKKVALIEDLVAAAPTVSGWQFTALKQPVSNMNVEMDGYKFNTEKLSFYATENNDFPDEINLTVVYDDFNEHERVTSTGCFIFLDNYLGELNFLTAIDHLKVVGRNSAQKELIPITKLRDYLNWRQKEFVEKYEGERHDTEKDNYSGFEGTYEDGKLLIGVMNTTLMAWDRKASHPWIAILKIKYQESDSGMPDNETYNLLNDMEDDEIMPALKDVDGYLNLGRQTAKNVREIFFACKDFRQPSRLFEMIQKRYVDRFEINYDIYKDKYWDTFSHLMK